MNRIVVITGAASGIGAALARRYRMMGDTVIPLARYDADVRDEMDMQDAAEMVLAAHGVPDIVIANAGTNATAKRGDLQALRKVHETNYYGVLLTLWPFIDHMVARGSGHLVAISSAVSAHGLPGIEAYCASKAAVNAHCEGMRRELYGTGVSVTTLAPGYVDTPSTRPHTLTRPWMLSADDFARRAVRAIERNAPHATIPWQMAVASTGLSLLPTKLVDHLLSGR